MTIALADVAAAARDGLMALSCTAGLLVLESLMQAELAEVAGPKGRHDAGRSVTRNGTASGSAVLGGRTVAVERPRAVTPTARARSRSLRGAPGICLASS